MKTTICAAALASCLGVAQSQAQTSELEEEIAATISWIFGGGYHFSHIDNPADLALGTYSMGGNDFPITLGAEYIERDGGTLSAYTQADFGGNLSDLLERMALTGDGNYTGTNFVGLSGIYSEGDFSMYGRQEVGIGGVSQVGLTYNEDIGGFTGIGSTFAGDYVIADGEFDNSWSVAAFGFGTYFQSEDESSPDVVVKIKPYFEQFSSDFDGWAGLGRGGTILADQTTRIDTEDNFYGIGLSQTFITKYDKGVYTSLGGQINVAVRDSEGTFYQQNGAGNLMVHYDETEIEFGGSLEVGIGRKFENGFSVSATAGVSVLPGVTGFDSRRDPTDANGQFRNENLTRTDFTIQIRRTF